MTLDRVGFSLKERNVALGIGSNAAIRDAVKRGLGGSFDSSSAVERELRSGS
jgi:hypothetical protein